MNDAFKPLAVIGLVIVAVAAVFVAPVLFTPRELIDWRSDYAAARQQSAGGKPLLLYFTAEWCGPCQQMKRTTFADRGVASAVDGKYLPVKIDIDRNAALAKQFGIEVLPTFKIVDRDQNVLKEESGAVDATTFVAWLNRSDQPPATRP